MCIVDILKFLFSVLVVRQLCFFKEMFVCSCTCACLWSEFGMHFGECVATVSGTVWCFDNTVVFLCCAFSIYEWKSLFQIALQKGIHDNWLSHCRLCQPPYMVPQHSLKPQIVRPSAQYPVGVGPCHTSHTSSQTYTAASNSQVFIPRIPQQSSNLISTHPRW